MIILTVHTRIMRANSVHCDDALVSSNVIGTQQSDGNNVLTMNKLLQLVSLKVIKITFNCLVPGHWYRATERGAIVYFCCKSGAT